MNTARIALFALLCLAALPSHADAEANAASLLCKQSWPGQRAVQQFCVKEQRNYLNWIRYMRKRLSNAPDQLSRVDECRADHQPNFRNVFDCITEERGFFSWFN